MAKVITRCRICLYKNKKAIEEPCCKCNEIQLKNFGYDNHYTPVKKENEDDVRELSS